MNPRDCAHHDVYHSVDLSPLIPVASPSRFLSLSLPLPSVNSPTPSHPVSWTDRSFIRLGTLVLCSLATFSPPTPTPVARAERSVSARSANGGDTNDPAGTRACAVPEGTMALRRANCPQNGFGGTRTTLRTRGHRRPEILVPSNGCSWRRASSPGSHPSGIRSRGPSAIATPQVPKGWEFHPASDPRIPLPTQSSKCPCRAVARPSTIRERRHRFVLFLYLRAFARE